jgi:hypothetical protein
MKKIILISSIFPLILIYLISIPKATLGQTFKSEAEIDAYYDAQLKQAEQATAQKNQAIQDQLDLNLKSLDRQYEIEKEKVLREVWGKDYEWYISLLPESNPNPEQIVDKYLYPSIPRAVGLNFIKNISVINSDLGKRVLEIYSKRPSAESIVTPKPISTPTQKIPSPSEMFSYIDSIENPYEALSDFENIKEKNPTMYKEVLKIAETKYFTGKTDPEAMFVYMDSLPEKEAVKMSNKMMIFNPTLQGAVNDMGKIKYPDGKFNDDGTIKTPAPISTPTGEPYTRHSLLPEKTVSEIQAKSESSTFIQKVSGFFKKLMFWK